MIPKVIKRCLVFFVLLSIVSVCSAQPNIEWEKTFGEGAANSVQQTSDGGFILAGYKPSYHPTTYDGSVIEYPSSLVYLIKTDSRGEKEWEKTFGEGVANSVQQTSDGGFILAGRAVWYEKFEPPTLIEPLPSGEEVEPYPAEVPCFAIGLIKVDSKGNEEWNKTLGWNEILGACEYDAYSVQQTRDGGFILAGEILIKTDSKGNEEWNKTFEGSIGLLQQTGDGGYTVALWFYGAGKYYLIKMDSKGNEEWNKTLSEKGASLVQQTSDGGYILAEYIISSYDAEGLIKTDVYLIKTDSKGVKEWEKTFRVTGQLQLRGVVTTDGGYILVGQLSNDVYLIKVDSDGNEEWNKTFTLFMNLRSVQQTSDSGYILAGERNGYVTLVKIAPEEMPPKQHGFEVITPIPTSPMTPIPSPAATPTLTPVVTPTSVPGAHAPGEPGFETIFAIAGLLAVAYLLRRRK